MPPRHTSLALALNPEPDPDPGLRVSVPPPPPLALALALALTLPLTPSRYACYYGAIGIAGAIVGTGAAKKLIEMLDRAS